MKKFLFETKWVGVGLVVIFSLIVAWITTTKTALFVKTVTPYVSQEVQAFLPVTFEKGVITEPENKVIAKEYVLGDTTLNVVLNTETDELSSDEIKKEGIYFSRKYMYGVTSNKTEIRDYSDIPDMTIDQEMFENGANWLSAHVGGYLFVTVFMMLLAYIGVAVLIYAGLTQLFIGKAVKTGFERTLRIATYGFLVCTVLELLCGFGINILIKLVAIVLLTYLINKQFYPVKE
jgi:hypothetical protein